MDVIKAIEDYEYYHERMGGSVSQWMAWRQQAMKEWGLDRSICDRNTFWKGDGAIE